MAACDFHHVYIASAILCGLVAILFLSRGLLRNKWVGRRLKKAYGPGGYQFCSALPFLLAQWWFILLAALMADLVVIFIYEILSASAVLKEGFSEGHESGVNDFLRKAAFWSIPACGVTFLFSIFAITRQIFVARRNANDGIARWHNDLPYTLPYPRDVALQVLFMPMVYHLMMCRSLVRQWFGFLGKDDCDNQGQSGKEIQSQLSDADYGMAEMYDAYALWCFGNLGMGVVEKCMSQDGLQGIISLLRATLLFGVQCYAVVELANGLYTNMIAVANDELELDLCINTTASKHVGDGGICAFGNVYYGAQFVASSIAIYNLFSFERKLHGELRQFKPGRKFWSMKIPVSFGFFGVIALDGTKIFTHFSSTQVKLLDAIIRAYLMGVVSLLNIYAWRPREEFYEWDELRDDDLPGNAREADVQSCPAALEDTSEANLQSCPTTGLTA